MHRPLTKSCQLKLVTFRDRDPREVNKVFWRSCSIILGGVISNAFKDNVSATLHSFPPPNGKKKEDFCFSPKNFLIFLYF